MYRKIVFLLVNVIPIPPSVKNLILLLISAIYFNINYNYRPYIFFELNIIEFLSLKSVLITLFAGIIYVTNEAGEFLKFISFIFIVLFNTHFCCKWIILLIGIIMDDKLSRFHQVKYKLI